MKPGKKSLTLRVAIPAVALMLGTGLLAAGGLQTPIEQDFTRVWHTSEGEGTDEIPTAVTSADCIFLNEPQRFIEDRERGYALRTDAMNRIVRWTVSINGPSVAGGNTTLIPRRNFIDDEIFTRMAAGNIQSAPLATDEEFLRRVTLDLTGRIPSATDVTDFLADSNSFKRDNVIDALIGSPEFTDKWTLFFGDLFQNNVNSQHVSRGIQGRDAFYIYLRDSIAQNKPYDVMAQEMITGTGDSWIVGQANWPVGNTISMGPAQDTYDGAAVDLGNMFMGINFVDCLLCHDGARHLDQVNLWGATETRRNLWGLAAYFSRTVMTRPAQGAMTGIVVSDDATTTFDYRLNTTNGNRVPRQPIGGVSSIAPRYPFSNPGSGVNSGENYRQAIARQITEDLQFSRAAVNYIWERMMGEAFVSPSNAFDLRRLDPNNPPPAPWTLQPTAWAGQFPDTQEPRSNGAVAQFLNAFGRGDRDLNPRRYDGSVLQGLTMLNNTFVTNRSRLNGPTPSAITTLLQQTSDPETIIRKLYLNTLSRRPTQAEVDALVPSFVQLGNATAAEDLQWVLLNRLPFLFNY